jgi:hypothetical protein
VAAAGSVASLSRRSILRATLLSVGAAALGQAVPRTAHAAIGQRDRLRGVAAWYDANDVAERLVPIDRWPDRSGNGAHLIQSAPTARPSVGTPNGVAAVMFDGVGNWMRAELPRVLQPPYLVAAVIGVRGGIDPVRHDSVITFHGSEPWRLRAFGMGDWGAQPDGRRAVAGGTKNAHPTLLLVEITPRETKIRQNGVPVASGPRVGGAVSSFSVGSSAARNEWLRGNIHELVLLEGPADAHRIAEVERALL